MDRTVSLVEGYQLKILAMETEYQRRTAGNPSLATIYAAVVWRSQEITNAIHQLDVDLLHHS